MIRAFYTTLVITLFCSNNIFAQKGFLGKNKAINLDVNSLLIDRELDVGINFMLNHNVNLIPSLGLINYNSRTSYREELFYGDSSYIGRRGFSIGLRLLATTYLTGQIAPLGHYYGYGYKFSKFNQLESKLRIRDSRNPNVQSLSSHDFYIFYGKSFLLSENLYLSLDIPIGILFVTGYDRDVSKYVPEMPRSYLGANIFSENSTSITYFYLRPNLRLGYFF